MADLQEVIDTLAEESRNRQAEALVAKHLALYANLLLLKAQEDPLDAVAAMRRRIRQSIDGTTFEGGDTPENREVQQKTIKIFESTMDGIRELADRWED